MKLFVVSLSLLTAFPLFAGKASSLLKPYEGAGLVADADIVKKKPVFIFYFADLKPSFKSPLTDRVEAISNALTPADEAIDPKDREFLARVRKLIPLDLEVPRSVADVEIAALKRELCSPRGRFPANAIFFQNSGSSQIATEKGYDIQAAYDVCHADKVIEGTTRVTWNLTNVGTLLQSPAWVDQLLSHPTVLRKALEEVLATFPPDTHRYYFYLEGRGNNEHALALQYAFDTSRLDGKAIRQRILDHKAEFGADPTAFALTTELATKVQGWVGEGQKPLSEDLGTTKVFLLEHLAKLGGGDPRKGAFFSLLWLNVAGGPLELDPNLKEFATAADYSKLNLPAIGGIRHFGANGALLLPFDKLRDFFGPDRSLEERLNQIFDQGDKNK